MFTLAALGEAFEDGGPRQQWGAFRDEQGAPRPEAFTEAGGGVKTLKAIAAPYGGVKFIPTGGISAGNLSDYLSLPSVHACGGSWMVKKDLISSGEFGQISAMAREAVALAQQIREGA